MGMSLLPNRFQQLMGLYTSSYTLLGRLVDLRDVELGRYHSLMEEHPTLVLDVLGKAPYTTFLRLTHQLPEGEESEPCAFLRVYHDARQAEVTHCRYHNILHRLFLPQTPARAIADHRLRMNVFCEKWLSYLLDLGHGRASMRWHSDIPDALLEDSPVDDDWWLEEDRKLLRPQPRRARRSTRAVES